MSAGLVDPKELTADAVDAASPAAAAGSTPDPSAAIAAPPLPTSAGPTPAGPAPDVPEPPPMVAAPDAGAAPMMSAPPIPGAQASAPLPPAGPGVAQRLLSMLPQLVTAMAAAKLGPMGGGAGLMEGFVRGHQAALAQRMQQAELDQRKSQMAASFVEHAMGELSTIGSSLGPAAYAQAIAAYKHLAPSFGIDPATFDQIGTSNSDVVSEKQREKLGQIYDRALKGLPDDMPPEDRAKVIVQVPGFGPMPLGHLATLAGQPIDPKTHEAIVPGAPDPNKSDRDRDVEALYTLQEQKLGRKLTRAEKAQVRADYVAKGRPAQTPDEQFLRAYATEHGKTSPDQLTAAEQLDARQKFALASKDPALAELTKSNAEVRNAILHMQLGQQPTKDDVDLYAKAIVDHKMAPSQLTVIGGGFGGGAAAFKRQVIAQALRTDPQFNEEEAESTYQLAKSPGFQTTVRFMQSVQDSMPRLQQTANQLANGNVRFENGLRNLTKQQLNDPTLKRFQVDVLGVADEWAKVMQGGGTGSATTDSKLSQASRVLSESDSPKAIEAALGEFNALIGFRRKALTKGTYLEQKAPPATTGVATLKFNPATGKTEPVSPVEKK